MWCGAGVGVAVVVGFGVACVDAGAGFDGGVAWVDAVAMVGAMDLLIISKQSMNALNLHESKATTVQTCPHTISHQKRYSPSLNNTEPSCIIACFLQHNPVEAHGCRDVLHHTRPSLGKREDRDQSSMPSRWNLGGKLVQWQLDIGEYQAALWVESRTQPSGVH